MKRRKWFALVTTALLALTAAGCGKQQDGNTADTENTGDEYVYVAEYQSLNEDGNYVGNVIIDENETVFFIESTEEGSKLLSLKIGESSFGEIPLDLDENTYVSALGQDMEGNLLLGLGGGGSDEETDGSAGRVEIRKIATDGKVLESIDTGNAFANDPEFYMQNILADKEGNYYICGGKTVFIVKPDGQLYCEIPVGTYINDMFAIKDEKIVISYFGNNGWELEEVDFAGKALKDLQSEVTFDYGTYQSGTDSDIIYTQGTILYKCNLEDEKPEEILNWVDSDIDSNNLRRFQILKDGRIAAVTIDWNSENGAAELAVLSKKKRSEIEEKKVLTYGTLYLPYFANKDIVAFNKQSDKYRIEVKVYGDDNTDYETKVSLLRADLSSGNGPDIIDMVYSYIEFEELVSMGVLEDLNPYLEKDEEIRREDYIESAMKAYEMDGKLYSIMPCFGINAIIGKVSDVGNGDTWTIEDMMAMMDTKDKDAEIIPYSTKYSILYMMCTANQDMFVNEETGECNFTGEEFMKVLEFANRFPAEADYDPNGPSQIEKIRNGKLILLNESITSVQLYQMYEYMFGEPVNLIGYPTYGESGLRFSSNGTTVAMNAQSENKEGVWEFIRFNLKKEKQENLQTANGGFPIMKDALEKQFEKDMEAEYYEDVDGSQKEQAKMVWGTEDFTVEVFAAKEEQVDHIRTMIETAGSNMQMDSQMFAIISEEAQGYFEGQKSAEDVAALVQNRVQTYINETR